jgi:hypothetical protein
MRALTCLCCLVTIASAGRAGIIIDEFDDSASAGGFVERDSTATTLNVGDLSVERTIGVHVLTGDAVGTIDSNVTTAGHLTADMVDVISNPPPTNGPIASMDIDYRFGEDTDLSEGGRNNALLLDFKSLTGATPPPYIRFWAFDETVPGLSYVRFFTPVPTSSDPFTMVVPFDSLRNRGSGAVPATFTGVYELLITFQANEFFGAPDELGWTVVLDRVRVGAIPEPSAFCLLCIGVVFLWTLTKPSRRGGQPHFAPRTPQNWDSPRRFC